MMRLTWLIAFVIVVLAMPLSAFAADNTKGEPQEQRVEVRVIRGEDGREVRQERRERRDGAEQQQNKQHEAELWELFGGEPGKGRGQGGDRGARFNWREMPQQAQGMMRGIQGRAMRINFHPEVENSALALGMNNKAIRADTINININMGDVVIDGNELSGGDSGQLLEMIMKMMMQAHGQNGMGGPGMDGPQGMAGPHGAGGPHGMGGPGGPGMHGGGDGPGNNGPGPWHERFDGSRPPMPGMPPHEMGSNEWHGQFMRWHDEVMQDPAANEFMDEGWHQRMLEMHEQGMGSEGDQHELFQRWHEEMMQRPDAGEIMNSDWHRRMMEMHEGGMGGHGEGMRSDAGDNDQSFWTQFYGLGPTSNIQTNSNYDSQYRDQMRAALRDWEKTPEVEEGGVRSPYYNFYFGNGELPQAGIGGQQGFHGEMDPHSAQQWYHDGPDQQHNRYLFIPETTGMLGGADIRPELLEMFSRIPEDVPTEFVGMMMKLGQLAWENPELAEQLMQLMLEYAGER